MAELKQRRAFTQDLEKDYFNMEQSTVKAIK